MDSRWIDHNNQNKKGFNDRLQVTGFRRHLFYKRAATAVSLTTLNWVSGSPKNKTKKVINHTRGGNAVATVNILSYGACVLTENI